MPDFLTNLSPEWKNTMLGALIFVIALIISRIVRWLIYRSFLSDTKKFSADITRVKFFKNAAAFIIWLVALGVFVSMIPELKALAIALFAGAGILLAIVGFAAQEAFSNIISGIFIVIFRPFRVGDMIRVGTQEYGIVEDITLRHTVILNFESKRVIIPNSRISSDVIVNDTIQEKKVCRFVEVGISYDSDLELAIDIIQSAASEHPRCIDNRSSKDKKQGKNKVEVVVLRFNEYSIDLRAYVWTNEPTRAIFLHSDINKEIKRRFDLEGIEIPFPYRTVVFKKDMEKK